MLLGVHGCCICFVMFFGDMMDEVTMMMAIYMMMYAVPRESGRGHNTVQALKHV